MLLGATAFIAPVHAAEPNSGFLEQEQPDWTEAMPIPPKLHPTLIETIRAANLLTHEKSILQISSPTYEQAHRLLLQNLLMMERQLHFSPAALARFQATSHPARSTVDPRIYEPNPLGIAMKPLLPNTITVTGTTGGYHSYTGDRPSRRSIVRASERRNALRTSQR